MNLSPRWQSGLSMGHDAYNPFDCAILVTGLIAETGLYISL